MPYTGECGYYFPKLDCVSSDSGPESMPSRQRPITPPCLFRQAPRSSSRRMRSPPPPKHTRHLLIHNYRARESVRATVRELQLQREYALDALDGYFNEDEQSSESSCQLVKYQGKFSSQAETLSQQDHLDTSNESSPRQKLCSLRFGKILTYRADEGYSCQAREASSDDCDSDEFAAQTGWYMATRRIPPPPCKREKCYSSEPSDDELGCTN